MYKFFFILISH